MSKKKPLFTLEDAHQNTGSWILRTQSVRNSDLLASSSYDGFLNLYRFKKQEKKIERVREIGGLTGCLNDFKFSKDRQSIVVTHSKEEAAGRYHTCSGVKEGITIIR